MIRISVSPPLRIVPTHELIFCILGLVAFPGMKLLISKSETFNPSDPLAFVYTPSSKLKNTYWLVCPSESLIMVAGVTSLTIKLALFAGIALLPKSSKILPAKDTAIVLRSSRLLSGFKVNTVSELSTEALKGI